MKTLFKLITLLSCLLLYVEHSEANCTFNALVSYSMNFGNVVVQRDTAVGQILATSTAPVNYQEFAICTGGGNYYDRFIYLGATSTGIAGVYATNIPGIGISLMNSTSGRAINTSGFSYHYAPTDPGIYSSATYAMQLVKTGPSASGSLQTGMVGHAWVDDGKDVLTFNLVGGSVTSLACAITTPNVNVALAPTLASAFNSVNSTRGDTPFTIGLNCDAGARINASLSFTQNTGTANNSVIQLTNAGSPGVASGVGIQLLYGGTPLQNNTNIVLKTSTGGVELPAGSFTARYFQTNATVTTGDANATATLNLTYQ